MLENQLFEDCDTQDARREAGRDGGLDTSDGSSKEQKKSEEQISLSTPPTSAAGSGARYNPRTLII